MKYAENEMKEILSQKLELSDQAEERLQETYSQIRMENKTKTKLATPHITSKM